MHLVHLRTVSKRQLLVGVIYCEACPDYDAHILRGLEICRRNGLSQLSQADCCRVRA